MAGNQPAPGGGRYRGEQDEPLEYWMPAKDIALEVLASDLPLYLGRDATARPADHKVLTSYFQAVTILNPARMAGQVTLSSPMFLSR
jgi:hypothetical protein